MLDQQSLQTMRISERLGSVTQPVFSVALLEDDSDAKLVRAMCIQVYYYVHNKYVM